MKTIDHETAAQRMARWLATGGALDAAHEESGRDDGLMAYAPSNVNACYADDGLSSSPPRTAVLICSADDGLQATMPTRYVGCRSADDGLTAAPRTLHHGCADDGLTAGGYTTSFCPIMAPEHHPAA